VETEKHVYYPGETIKGSVHLLVNKPLGPDTNTGVRRLDLKLRGKETFKYKCSDRKNDKSCRNSYLIFDNV
jgi:sporulation-control protein spo0M